MSGAGSAGRGAWALLPRRILSSSLSLASAERLNSGFAQLRYNVSPTATKA